MFLKYCYLNGEIIELKDAKVSVRDIGILRGYGIFDFLKVKESQPILLENHLDRLENSAKQTNLKLPISRQEIKGIIDQLLIKNEVSDACVRIVLTGGESADGLTCNPETPTLFILLQTLPEHKAEIYEEGAKLITFEHQREMPSAKTNNYITKMKLQEVKDREEAYEILYISDGKVLEGSTSNFFIFKNDKLITAKDNILSGTRRDLLLDIAKGKFDVEERELLVGELKEADEAFIASTSRDIVPVIKIDDLVIGDGKVGKNTRVMIGLLGENLSVN